jgi:lysophospholipase L1-like esterase
VSLLGVMIGDSIAYGQGATRPADSIGHRLVSGLVERGIDIEMRVVAVPGATSAGLTGQVRRALAMHPDLAVIVIGANDITHLVPAERAAAALGAAVRDLVAAGVRTVVAPAPDLSVVPWVPPAFRDLVQATSRTLRMAQVGAAGAAGARIADVDETSAAAFAADPRLFSSDEFHPSSAGYEEITKGLLPHVLGAAGEALEAQPANHDRHRLD